MTLLLSPLQQNHQKRQRLPFFYNKAIEKGDGRCRLLLLPYNETIEEDDDSLPLPSLLQQNKNKEGNGNKVAITFFAAAKPKQKKVMAALLSWLQKKKKNKKVTIAFTTVAFFAVAKPKEKGLREGAYLQALILGHVSSALTMEFVGSLQARCHGSAPTPTALELWCRSQALAME